MVYILRTILSQGWSPILIVALAVVGYLYEVNIWLITPLLLVILVVGLVVAIVSARERQLELGWQRLKQLAGYFSRRFMGSSSLSIFAIIDSLFSIDDPQLWDWARACDMSQRVFDNWCNSFINRLESDTRMRRFDVYLRVYLNEMWLINTHYFEFIEQFYEIAQGVELSRETRDQYDRFVTEYNTFVQNFQEHVAKLRKTARTEIEPPSVKMARALSAVK